MDATLSETIERLIQAKILSPQTTPTVLRKIRESVQQPPLPNMRPQ